MKSPLLRITLVSCLALIGGSLGCSSTSSTPDGTGGHQSGAGGSGGASSSATQGSGGKAGNGGTAGAGGMGATGGQPDSGGSTGTGGSARAGSGGGGDLDAGTGNGGRVGGPDAGKDVAGKQDGPVVGPGGSSGSSGGPGADGGTAPGEAGSVGPNPGGGYNPDFLEFYGQDCQVPDPKDAKVSGSLPDLFTMSDGSTRMSKKSDWRCQRAYLKRIVEKYVHGEKPGKPEKVTGSVSNSAISVHVENKGKSIDFSVSVSLPKAASGPVPIIIGMGGSSLDASIVSGEGVATAIYDHQKMASETSRTGLFTDIYGSNGISAQIGWAWGISRVIDVLIAERDAGRNKIIDPTAVGVTGCSRNGKAAFNVGAFDERIALGIPQESGTGGVSAFRIVNTAPTGPNGKPAQSLDSAWSEAQGWFGSVFGTYRSKVDVIPGDTHAIAAMYAPRGLLVLDNSRIGELCASCQHAASAAAAEVYKALGVEKNIEYHGGNPSDPHNHCTFYPDTQGEPLKRAIRAFLTKKAAPDGRITPQSAGTADLKKWIPWTAPTLAD